MNILNCQLITLLPLSHFILTHQKNLVKLKMIKTSSIRKRPRLSSSLLATGLVYGLVSANKLLQICPLWKEKELRKEAGKKT